jgi:hypothetical protein
LFSGGPAKSIFWNQTLHIPYFHFSPPILFSPRHVTLFHMHTRTLFISLSHPELCLLCFTPPLTAQFTSQHRAISLLKGRRGHGHASGAYHNTSSSTFPVRGSGRSLRPFFFFSPSVSIAP